jgi:hypothetical protein
MNQLPPQTTSVSLNKKKPLFSSLLIMKLMRSWKSHHSAISGGFCNDPLGDRSRVHLAISIEDDKYERNALLKASAEFK